ncbi:TPA: transketolase family protein [Candidatus Woesearchaeota archaeon]|nr:transketolase family protein [Candidatus Woesearchaeota archaeon]
MPEMIATRDGFGKALLNLGKENKLVVNLEADLGKSTKSILFAKEFPDRTINFGISEQDMITTAAGLAYSGKIPFASTFAIFTERAFEQIRNSVARTNLNVKIVGSHSGLLTGDDGDSAQCIEDVAVYRSLPNMVVLSPADAIETEKATYAMAEHTGPMYLRIGREKIPVLFDANYKFEFGKGVLLKDGKDVTIFATGPLVSIALDAGKLLESEGVSARIINIHTIKPIDKDLIIKAATETKAIVTAEDHNIIGGLGSAVSEVLTEYALAPLERVGVKDRFGESGKPAELYKKYGLTAEDIVKHAKKAIARKRV